MRPSPPKYELHWPGKRAWSPAPSSATLRHTDAFDGPPRRGPSLFGAASARYDFRNRLIWGDNLPVMEALLAEWRGKIDLIYLDPPFDANHDFAVATPLGNATGMGDSRGLVVEEVAFRDTWGGGEDSYAQMLYERLGPVRELLSPTGSLIVHVNWRVAHVVQLLLDEVFGAGERQAPGAPGFRCEIVWGFGGGSAVKNVYRRKHDNLFWYTASKDWTFNPQYRPYSEGTRSRGLTAVKGPSYELRAEGATLETWWADADVQKILSPTAHENLKFPTQKPESLLERIIRGHSNPDDLVADFFCGSGATGAVAERLGRRWIMADESRFALHTSRKRLAQVQELQAAAGEPFRAFDVYASAPG
ncbi:MAG: DNA methyltransferase [Actinomycetota bacterium]